MFLRMVKKMADAIRIENLNKSFGSVKAVKNLSLRVKALSIILRRPADIRSVPRRARPT